MQWINDFWFKELQSELMSTPEWAKAEHMEMNVPENIKLTQTATEMNYPRGGGFGRMIAKAKMGVDVSASIFKGK